MPPEKLCLPLIIFLIIASEKPKADFLLYPPDINGADCAIPAFPASVFHNPALISTPSGLKTGIDYLDLYGSASLISASGGISINKHSFAAALSTIPDFLEIYTETAAAVAYSLKPFNYFSAGTAFTLTKADYGHHYGSVYNAFLT
ncbi:MAG: hypothetical protein ACLFQK_06875, partial [Fibrobacterota bacterium]